MTNLSPRLADVKVGDALPELRVPLTASLIVAGAVASRDFTPVHHDKGAAQRSGVDDVFMNILTTNGLVGRFVTDWAGPDARITRVAIRLGTPNLPGDTMKLRGTVNSWVVLHHPPIPGYELPLAIAVIDLEEGTRIVANIVDCPLDEIRIDMPVECTIEEIEPGYKLPLFRRIR